jgi:hypothetical protein
LGTADQVIGFEKTSVDQVMGTLLVVILEVKELDAQDALAGEPAELLAA